MTGPDFLDTNVLVYAYVPRDQRKQEIARVIVRRALAGGGAASTQVLSEFASTFLHKLSPPAQPEDLLQLLDILSPIRLVPLDHGTVRRAIEARTVYGIHIYDGMVVAAAERGGCGRILSEDLNAGQKYFQIPVENPFV
jgi:predicted nucleic acid-binding protein